MKLTDRLREYADDIHSRKGFNDVSVVMSRSADRIDMLEQIETNLCELHNIALAENEALRKDAERYRWLRDNPWNGTELEGIIKCHLNAVWDRAIDAAMKGE